MNNNSLASSGFSSEMRGIKTQDTQLHCTCINNFLLFILAVINLIRRNSLKTFLQPLLLLRKHGIMSRNCTSALKRILSNIDLSAVIRFKDWSAKVTLQGYVGLLKGSS